MADPVTPTVDDLLAEAATLPDFEFRPGDAPVLVTSGTGSFQKVPRRALGRAIAEGLQPVEGEALDSALRSKRVQEEQAGIGSALLAGTEAALSTATFGATDAAMEGLAFLAGTSREEYLRKRAERQEGSPTAAGVGTAAGLIVPALLTEGISLAADAGMAAKAGAAAVNVATAPLRGVMRAGRAATAATEAGIGRLLPSAMTAEELGAAYRAAKAAGTVTPGLRAAAKAALRTGGAKAVGGLAEGALWGAGEQIREAILGEPADSAEAVLANIGTDALLFSAIGGGLGVFEAALPVALRGAEKISTALYDKFPAFGRDALAAKWAAEPGRTGVAAATAEELLAQRDRLVALDNRFSGVLDSMAAASPEAVRAASSHVDAIEALAGARKGTLDAVLQAPAEVRDAILENATAAISMEARSKGALEQMLGSTPDSLRAAFAKGSAFEALVAGDREAVGRMLSMKADVLSEALDNVAGIAALEEITGRKAISAISRMPPDAARWYVQNAGRLAELEAALPGYWGSFRGMTTGAESRFAAAQADDVLNNWRLSITNPNERARVIGEVIEQKTAELDAGEDLAMKLYQLAIPVEAEVLAKVGEVGGPPSIGRVQTAIVDLADQAEQLAARVADPIAYSPKLAKEVEEIATNLRRDFVGLTPEEIEEGLVSKVEEFHSNAEAAFRRVGEYRKNLGSRIRKLEAKKLSLSPAEEDTLDAMIELRNALTSTYHDASIFGEAGTIRARADDAFRQWKEATGKGGLFDAKFRENILARGEQKRVISRPKINQWFNQMGDARAAAGLGEEVGTNASAWNGVSDAFINLVDTAKELLPRANGTAVEITPEALQAFAQKATEATEEFSRRGYYTRILNQMKIHVDGGGGLNMAGLPTGLGTMGGFPHGVPTASTSGLGVLATGTPEAAVVGNVLSSAASTVPGGGLAAKGVSSLLSIPSAQRQVTARVRGMVAIEEMGRNLSTGIEDGARWLIGQATGKKLALGAGAKALMGETSEDRRRMEERRRRRETRAEAPPAGAPATAPARRAPAREARRVWPGGRDDATLDGIIVEANRLARDPAAMADRIEEQTFAAARDLPATSSAVGQLATRAAAVIARAAPVPNGQPLDSWTPSDADRAAIARVVEAVSKPLGLYDRALDGTLTKAEVDAVGEVTPTTLARMRAAAQAHVEAARVEGRVLSEQHRRGIETLLGYPLTTGSSRPSVGKLQGVFGASRAGHTERPTDGMTRPLPGAAKVTLGDRYMTPQQAAAER